MWGNPRRYSFQIPWQLLKAGETLFFFFCSAIWFYSNLHSRTDSANTAVKEAIWEKNVNHTKEEQPPRGCYALLLSSYEAHKERKELEGMKEVRPLEVCRLAITSHFQRSKSRWWLVPASCWQFTNKNSKLPFQSRQPGALFRSSFKWDWRSFASIPGSEGWMLMLQENTVLDL